MNGAVSSHLRVRTARRGDFLDITDHLRNAVAEAQVDNGAAFVFCAHTTCSLLINEWEDGAHQDLRRAVDDLAPPENYYRHDDLTVRTQNLQDEEPVNGHSHVAQMFVGATSQMVPIIDGAPVLGRWQRLMLLELDRARERDLYFTVVGSTRSPVSMTDRIVQHRPQARAAGSPVAPATF